MADSQGTQRNDRTERTDFISPEERIIQSVSTQSSPKDVADFLQGHPRLLNDVFATLEKEGAFNPFDSVKLQSASTHVRQGDEHYESQDYVQALACYEQAYELFNQKSSLKNNAVGKAAVLTRLGSVYHRIGEAFHEEAFRQQLQASDFSQGELKTDTALIRFASRPHKLPKFIQKLLDSLFVRSPISYDPTETRGEIL